MFENLSIGHLAVVLVIVLLLFGAKRIPEIAGSFGKGIKEFKNTMSDTANSVTSSDSPRDVPREVPRYSNDNASLKVGDNAQTQAEQNAEREPKRLVR
ncbi:MAG: twin-arginine translocase TatA/TatE family subunit [Gemmatimonadaceae bacterium]